MMATGWMSIRDSFSMVGFITGLQVARSLSMWAYWLIYWQLVSRISILMRKFFPYSREKLSHFRDIMKDFLVLVDIFHGCS